jgi:hypothetical protein
VARVKARSHSSSPTLTALLFGNLRHGTAVSRHDLRFGDYILSLTAPGAPRMPNGIECPVAAREHSRVAVGEGGLLVGTVEVSAGPGWNPIPSTRPHESLPPGAAPTASGLLGLGPARVPEEDAVITGYVAGLVLLHGRRNRAALIAERAAAKMSPLNATLLRHAARGEVPEPVHALLATGDPRPLLAFEPPRGLAWLRGLVSAGLPLDPGMLAGLSAPSGLQPSGSR